MPPAKKVAEKPVQEDSEQSTDVVDVAVKKKLTPKKIVESIEEDSDDPISKITQKSVMVYMSRGESYYSPEAEFTKEAPFVLMDAIDATRLIKVMPNRFVYATKEQVQEFYSLG